MLLSVSIQAHRPAAAGTGRHAAEDLVVEFGEVRGAGDVPLLETRPPRRAVSHLAVRREVIFLQATLFHMDGFEWNRAACKIITSRHMADSASRTSKAR